jgi:FKBP-type peptidyl-prolyl cis-trans isomerase (trigger factor)
MVENEINEMVRGLEYRLSQQGMTKELYLQVRGMDEDAFLEEVAPMAEERLKQALVLFEIAQKEEIEIDQDQVQSETLRTFDAISRQMTPNEAKKLTKSQFIPNLMTNITVDMTTKTTLDYLRAIAKGEPWPLEDETPEENESVEEDEDDEITSDLETETEEESNQEIIEQGNTDEQTTSNDGEEDPVEE